VRGLTQLYIDGGETIRHFPAEDLVDTLTITRVPILPGQGRPLFDGLARELPFRHVSTDALDGLLVKSTYKRVRDAAR
jgi:dihydrofolate reductase